MSGEVRDIIGQLRADDLGNVALKADEINAGLIEGMLPRDYTVYAKARIAELEGRSAELEAELQAERERRTETLAEALFGEYAGIDKQRRIEELEQLVRDFIDAPCTTCDCWQDEFRCPYYDGADCGLVARALKLGIEVAP